MIVQLIRRPAEDLIFYHDLNLLKKNNVPNTTPESVEGGVLSCPGDAFISSIFI